MTTNAASSRLATHLNQIVSGSKVVTIRTRLAGEVRHGIRRGDHLVEAIVLVGMTYNSILKSSLGIINEAVNPDFIKSVAEEVGVQTEDVFDAINGQVRGRKGIVTSLNQSLAGVNNDSTSARVYEPLVLDGEVVPDCSVYIGTKSVAKDDRAPVAGTVYIRGILLDKKIIEKSANGDHPDSQPGPVARVKVYIGSKLDLPMARYCSFRLLPGESFQVKNSKGTVTVDGSKITFTG